MAKMNEDMVVIKVSELIRGDQSASEILNGEIISTIEEAVQALVGAGKLVEIIKDES